MNPLLEELAGGRFKEYTIIFSGLSEGIHNFTFTLTDDFFKTFPNSLIEKGKVDVALELEKKKRMLVLQFQLNGQVNVECDRCLQRLNLPVSTFYKLIIKLSDASPSPQEAKEDIIYIPPESSHLNVSHPIYETLILGMPLSRKCEMDISGTQSCDSKVLDILNGEELDSEVDTDQTEEAPIDPRWAALKNLKNK